jgi:C-terminal processing protease CtpA/Prc
VNSRELSAFYGTASPPVELRWIENRPVVTRVRNVEGIHPGDEVTKIDGEPYRKRADELAKHIAASTPQSMMSRVTALLLAGPPDSVVRVALKTGDGPEREIELKRGAMSWRPYRAGEVIRLIKPKIGYVDLERLSNAQVDEMFEKFRDTEAIIMDMRGYPQGTAWSIAPRLSEKPQPVAAQFRRNLVMTGNEDESGVATLLFEQRLPATTKPRYKGKTVMLIDERAISQSEHSGLFYRTANGTVFVGSATTGANGDVTWFMAPGGLRIGFSGHDVRWRDGRQLQRVGLKPDIAVQPTIEGIRAGRDEVLERAVAFIENGK